MANTMVKTPLHRTHINIPVGDREKLTVGLNKALAHLIDLKLQVKQAHWNVKGKRFIALHEMFDMLTGELEGYADTVAERVTTLGGTALGTVSLVAELSELEAYPLEATSGDDHLQALIERYAQVGELVRKNINEADDLKDKSTADVYTEVSRGLDLRLWFLEAHFQDKD